MRILSFNVNSIRMRLANVQALIERHAPDVLCLQETKVVDDAFPAETFRALGYEVAVHGQKTYNGVALLSRPKLVDVVRGLPGGAGDPQARLIAAAVGGLTLVDVYVPNGEAVGSDKFAYKLEWLARLKNWLQGSARPEDPLLVCGDFNIAPEDRDVHDPGAWRGQVLFSDAERAALKDLCSLGLADLFRRHEPGPGHYTWWDYRSGAFRRNLGLRIDLFLGTEAIARRCRRVWIDVDERRAEQPSDHAPILADLDDA